MKLIGVDVDGTLLNSENKISPRTRQALIRAGEMGHKIVIVSGRPTSAVKDLAKELEFDKFDGLLANYNGGSITDYSSGKVLANHNLERNLALEILDKTRFLNIIIPYKDMILSDKNHKFLQAESQLLGLEAKVVSDIRDKLDFDPNKILFAAEIAKLEESIPFLVENFGNVTSQVRSHRNYYEIMPKGLSKGNSLLEIAKLYDIDQADIIAFGDEMNDFTMIEVAGVGVAMANAVDEIKEIADYVTLSNDEDGIGDYLEKFIL